MGGLRIRHAGGAAESLNSDQFSVVSQEKAETGVEQQENVEAANIDSESVAREFIDAQKVELRVVEAKVEGAQHDVVSTQAAIEKYKTENPVIAERIATLLQTKREQAKAAGNRLEAKKNDRRLKDVQRYLDLASSFDGQDDAALSARREVLLDQMKSIPEDSDPTTLAQKRKYERELDDVEDFMRGRKAVEHMKDSADDSMDQQYQMAA